MGLDGTAVWHGREFQDFCLLVLRKRYASIAIHKFQVVPDTHKGDLGIEAFGFGGAAYQCYAAEEPLQTQQRYEKQRAKLTEDLGKLKKNAPDFLKMLGAVKLNAYVFLVHKHDSRLLINHAQKKAQEVVNWGLPFIDPDFTIVIETLDDYKVEAEQLFSIPEGLVRAERPDDDVIDDWGADNSALVKTIDGKLGIVEPRAKRRQNIIRSLTRAYLAGSQSMDLLNLRAPDVEDAILKAQMQHEDFLVLDYDFNSSSSYKDVSALHHEVAHRYSSVAQILDSETIEILAWMTIADWLMRCPLDFEETEL